MKRILNSLGLIALEIAASSHAQSASPTSVISVMSYGATGDGATNDTAAINSAIAACAGKSAPHNGCTLYFPAGVYMTTGIKLKSFVHIKGDGWGTSVIQLLPNTAADVLSIPADTFNFSLYGLTLDGNSAKGGTGNCFSTASTPASPTEWNTANKQTAPVNAQKFGHIEEVMFSNCSGDGVHINPYNYMLFFDNFYAFNNGVYGVYTAGTNSGFSNFQIERNGTAGIHAANANNRFTSGEVIWNGANVSTEAAVYVAGARNIITAVETEDNYTSGFFDKGDNNTFIGCVSDTNGYVPKNPSASSRRASGFVIAGKGGTFLGDKVTSYRGRLPDGNFATEWPYTINDPNQATVDISSDSTNRQPPATAKPSPQSGTSAAGNAACIKSPGPPIIFGSCSTPVSSSGSCTCN